ncbi:MAG: fibronectin type III domain-containing protein [Thaumarchaeota archaeon]|nr:fibronectin type III domain-containing protein [Nitrososphaerota archaeon]MDE1817696.1 fibronectin type III domain-containing protein [Nitrososphaerota archaeon]MDE1876175.1 fibronectin type III domain-containing protein [Nitrososphaerota archaeon]
MFSHDAFAMGPAPGTCNNEYDGSYVSAIITAGNQTFYPLQNNVTFKMNIGQSYNLTTIIHVPNQSSQGNSLPGSLWYSSNEIGYDQNYCSPTVNPSTNYTISMNVGFPNDYNPNQSQVISVYWAPHGYSYTVDWVVPPTSPPSAPQNLQASAASSSQINLSWSAPSNNGGSPVIGYMIERSTDDGSTWNTIVSNTGSTSTTFSDTGLVHSTTYTYQVSAINSAGMSVPSNTASATTLNTVPSVPTGLTATAKLLKINLSWTAPSDNGGTPITGYMIERSTDNGSTWSTLVENTGSTGTTYSDTNVLPLTIYTYRVSAINDIGTGNPSNTASASIASTPTLP